MPSIISLAILTILFIFNGLAKSEKSRKIQDTKLMYTESGEISQMVYATNAIEKCNPLLAFCDGNVAIVISIRKAPSGLIIPNNGLNRRSFCYHNVAGFFTGFPCDIRYILNHINTVANSHKFIFGETMSIDKMSSSLSKVFTSYLYDVNEKDSERTARPLACSGFLLEYVSGCLELTLIEQTGNIKPCKLAVVGSLNLKAEIFKEYENCKNVIELMRRAATIALEEIGEPVTFDLLLSSNFDESTTSFPHFASIFDLDSVNSLVSELSKRLIRI